ncbi:MAG: GPW/gp25 family protein [Sphingomonas sp.]|nr:GPW/gp25 family protein [Sphingomonas sp.]
MIGVDATTGRQLAGDAHLAQSIGDILSTPIGSRVIRRDYGSTLFELIDQPMNALGRLRLFAATAEALRRWEPRFRLTRVGIAQAPGELAAGGAFTLQLEGQRTDDPDPNALTKLTIPLTALRPAS